MGSGGQHLPLDPQHTERKLKVEKIFQQFDRNADGRLNRAEMAALVMAVNPRVKFSEEQISAILDEVFRTYGAYIEGDKGLSFDGLLRTYDDGAGNVDRDFDALGLELDAEEEEDIEREGHEMVEEDDDDEVDGRGRNELDEGLVGGGERLEPSPVTSPQAQGKSQAQPPSRMFTSITDENKFSRRTDELGAWASSPNNGIEYDETWKLILDLETFLRKVEKKIEGRKKEREEKKNSTQAAVESGEWSKELPGGGSVSPSGEDEGDEMGRKGEDLGSDYAIFKRTVADLRTRANSFLAQGELHAFDAHWAMGRTFLDHLWYQEALTSFHKAIGLQPDDPRAHFQAGNALYSIENFPEAKKSYERALELADSNGPHYLLRPQVYVNLGIVLEGEGMLLGACDHYREAAILNPKHHRALKLLGSAYLGVGEYRLAETALHHAIALEENYADAHCDLGSALAALGENNRATSEFQRAIDLQPKHADALYNLGGLLRDCKKYSDAAAMYNKVLEIRPNDWRAQLNKAVSLMGAGKGEEAKKALKEAFKTTNRVEVYDAIMHLKHIQKKPKGMNTIIQSAEDDLHREREANGGGGGGSPKAEDYLEIELGKFHRANKKTSPRLWLRIALDIRRFQKRTRLHKFNPSTLKAEWDNSSAQESRDPGHLVRKAEVESILRRLLHFLNAESFQQSMKAVNEKILAILDRGSTGGVDLGMFLASIAPLCASLTPEKRKRLVFQMLAWRRPIVEGQISKGDARLYIKLLRAMYLPSQDTSGMWEVRQDDEEENIAYPQFVDMFDEMDWGFGILTLLSKLEVGDRIRQQGTPCSVCAYPIIGSRFKEVDANFDLCSTCYSEGKVPKSFKQHEYSFKEYGAQSSDSIMERFRGFSFKGSPASMRQRSMASN